MGEEYKGKFGIIGTSKPMEEVYRLIGLAAPTQALVHIVGESGTGKELVARALHYYGSRKSGPYIAVNCAAIVESLLESELFGHEKGAFTGAVGRKLGYLEVAKDGTLFLDEIAKIGTPMQNRLLRPLDSYPFFRVGGLDPIHTNTRFVTASSTSLEDAVASGKISDEFYYRIAGATIVLPPLRERNEDIKLLAGHYCETYSKEYGKPLSITPDGLEYLESLHWPGNVRQLKRVVEAAVVLKEILHDPQVRRETHPDSESDSETIKATLNRSDFEQVFRLNGHELLPDYSGFIPYQSILETIKRRKIPLPELFESMMQYVIKGALAECQDNQTEAAKRLGMTFRSFRYQLGKGVKKF